MVAKKKPVAKKAATAAPKFGSAAWKAKYGKKKKTTKKK